MADTAWDRFAGIYYVGTHTVGYFKKNEKNNFNDSCCGGWMLLDAFGKPVIDYKLRLPFDLEGLNSYYDQLGCFQCENGKWGLCDDQFKVLQPPVYDHVWLVMPDTNELYQQCWFLGEANNHYGLIDTSGKLLIDTIYEFAYRPTDTHVYLSNGDDIVEFDGNNATMRHSHVSDGAFSNGTFDFCFKEFIKKYPWDYFGDYVYLQRRGYLGGDMDFKCIPMEVH
ncbi:MAG TPA: WG repeat-containing protein [Bacteroidia bacterium]|nr:WG repeat-containing protein [Bacteroidia bacterium]